MQLDAAQIFEVVGDAVSREDRAGQPESWLEPRS
jgi:hypothetical protein